MDVEARYDRLAPRYDRASRVPNLLGFRDRAYHRAAVDMLSPEAGSTVLVLGCGTGLDFEGLQGHVGRTGRIIGVDVSQGMLDQAAARVVRHGWTNVVLHQADVQDWVKDPPAFDHVLASFCLKFMPAHADVVKALAIRMPKEGRFAVVDFTLPRWLRPLALLLRVFGHDHATFARHPDRVVDEVFPHVVKRRFWFKQAYAVVGSFGDG